MRVSIVLEQRFLKAPGGAVWEPSGVYAHRFWQRYLEVFDTVNVIARVEEGASENEGFKERADGEGVSFSCIPHFLGPWQYAMNYRRVRRGLHQSIEGDDAVILRAPGLLASILHPYLRKSGHPYAVEVVGDPYEVFSPGAVMHPLRPVFRRLFSRRLRGQCENASACAYVTEKTLQKRYPPGNGAYSTHYSSIELPPEAIVERPRSPRSESGAMTAVFVGSLEQMYKAPDVLIAAVNRCVENGIDLRLDVIGDGKKRVRLQRGRAARALGDRLRFLGRLPAGKSIRDELDKADLFVLPSRTEGMPRAMIEAMARALPCIGSTVGGFPELLCAEDLVPPGDAEVLAEKIRAVVTCPRRMAEMSWRNLEKARLYGSETLQARRTAFYQYVKEAGRAA